MGIQWAALMGKRYVFNRVQVYLEDFTRTSQSNEFLLKIPYDVMAIGK
jgi:hypothetical protein